MAGWIYRSQEFVSATYRSITRRVASSLVGPQCTVSQGPKGCVNTADRRRVRGTFQPNQKRMRYMQNEKSGLDWGESLPPPPPFASSSSRHNTRSILSALTLLPLCLLAKANELMRGHPRSIYHHSTLSLVGRHKNMLEWLE